MIQENKLKHDYYVINVSGKQYIVHDGDKLEIDYINNSNNTVDAALIYDSNIGVVNKICTLNIAGTTKGEKLRIVKFVRRHNRRREIGFRAKYTLVEFFAKNVKIG